MSSHSVREMQQLYNNHLSGVADVIRLRPARPEESPAIAQIGSRAIRLLSSQVLIRLIAPERLSHGLWIPDSAKRRDHELYRGVVIAVGPGERNRKGHVVPCDITPGETCVFYWLGGIVDVTKLTDDGNEYRIVKEEHIRYSEGRL